MKVIESEFNTGNQLQYLSCVIEIVKYSYNQKPVLPVILMHLIERNGI